MSYVKWIAILLPWVLLVICQMCKPTPPPEHICPTFDTAAFIASLPETKPDTFYVPEPHIVYKDTGSTKYVYIPKDIDSLEVVLAFFTPSTYLDLLIFTSDSLPEDTLVSLTIRDSINQNRIQRREVLDFTVYPQYKLVTTTVTKPFVPKNLWLLGAGVGKNPNEFGATLNGMLLTKKQQAYTVSWDFLNRDFYFTLYWPINRYK